MKRSSCASASSMARPRARSRSRRRWMRTLSPGTLREGRTSSSRRSLDRMRSPTMRTAPMEMIWSQRTYGVQPQALAQQFAEAPHHGQRVLEQVALQAAQARRVHMAGDGAAQVDLGQSRLQAQAHEEMQALEQLLALGAVEHALVHQ